MADLINFTCPACGRQAPNQTLDYPGTIHMGYDDSVVFSDFVPGDKLPPVENDTWPRAEITPRPGERRILKARHPFAEKPGHPFFSLYQPAPVILNGIDCHPAAMADSALVQSEVKNVIERTPNTAWLEVEIKQTYGVDYALATQATEEAGTMLTDSMQFHDVLQTTYEKWWYLDVSTQGDLGFWYIIEKELKRLVLFGEWGFHTRAAYLSNIQISPPTWKLLEENYLGDLEK